MLTLTERVEWLMHLKRTDRHRIVKQLPPHHRLQVATLAHAADLLFKLVPEDRQAEYRISSAMAISHLVAIQMNTNPS